VLVLKDSLLVGCRSHGVLEHLLVNSEMTVAVKIIIFRGGAVRRDSSDAGSGGRAGGDLRGDCFCYAGHDDGIYVWVRAPYGGIYSVSDEGV